MPLDKETRAEIVALLKSRSAEDSGPKEMTDSGMNELLVYHRRKLKAEEDDEDDAVIKKRRRKKFWGWVFGVLIPGIPGGAYAYIQIVPEAEAVVAPVDVKREVEKRVGSLEKSIQGCESKVDAKGNTVACTEEEAAGSIQYTSDQADKKANRLGDLHFEQQRLMLDQYEAIRKAQNAADRRAREIKDPPTVKLARDQLKAYDELKAREQLDAALNKGDPFDGI